jgi:hypothetical protein
MRQRPTEAAPKPAVSKAPTADAEPAEPSDKNRRCCWLETSPLSVEEQLALDEALLEEAEQGLRQDQTVRTWMAEELVVVVGSSSRLDTEVNLAACQAAGVRVVRRPSGGATVVLGPGCLSRRLSQRRSAACSHSRPALCGIRCGGQGRLPQRHERPGDRRPQGLGQCPAGAEAVGALPRHAARRLRYRAGDATAQPSAARTCVSSPATAHLVSHQPAARAGPAGAACATGVCRFRHGSCLRSGASRAAPHRAVLLVSME